MIRIKYSIMAILLIVMFSASAHAIELEVMSSKRAINTEAAVKSIRETISMASAKNPDKDKLLSSIRLSMHILRGPNPDGVTYRFAKAQPVSKIQPTLVKSEIVHAVFQNGQWQTVVAEANIIRGFQIQTPLHRGFFKNNGNVRLKSYKIDYKINGVLHSDSRDYDRDLTRDTLIDIPIPAIAEWARIEMSVGVAAADAGHAIVHLSAKYPEIEDDPINPFAYAIRQLNESFVRLENGRVPKEIVKFQEQAIKAIEVVPTTVTSFTATTTNSQIGKKLEYILSILQGNTTGDQRDAVEELKDLINSLK